MRKRLIHSDKIPADVQEISRYWEEVKPELIRDVSSVKLNPASPRDENRVSEEAV